MQSIGRAVVDACAIFPGAVVGDPLLAPLSDARGVITVRP